MLIKLGSVLFSFVSRNSNLIGSLCYFQDKGLSNGLFFLELLSAAEPRVVNWNLVTKGENGKDFSVIVIYSQKIS